MYNTGLKKWIPYIAIAVLAVILVGTIFITQNNSKKQKKQIEALNQQVESLQQDMTEVYVTTQDVKAGNAIEFDSLSTTLIPTDAIPENAITDEDELTDKLYKINLKAGSYLTSDMVMKDKLTNNMRELDIVMDEIPIGLEPGDYVDIRISFPLGQDYIAMSHKRVLAINGNTVKLVVIEHDFYRYESMKTDLAQYQSTKIYAAKYLEAGIQKRSKVYYPPNLDVIKQSILDPNMNTQDFLKLINSREKLEEQLVDNRVDKNITVTDARKELKNEFNRAREEYADLEAEKEAAAAAESE